MTRWLYLSIALTLAAAGVSLYFATIGFERLPERIPVHWNIRGEVDATTPKEDAWATFWLMPSVMAGMIALTVILPRLSPVSFKVEPFRGVWGYVMMLVVSLLGAMHVVILWASLGQADGSAALRVFAALMFLFFALIAPALGKVRRNFWMGVRTPWTLASERVWDDTHRLTARLWFVGGLVGMAAVLAGVPLPWTMAILLVIASVPVLYSLIHYKRLEKTQAL